MNLIGDPWVPVVLDSGRCLRLGLQEVYARSHEIRDLALGPPQRVAVMRLLLCITQAALDGPTDEDAWRGCREQIVPDSLRYLGDRRDKFELFGEQPFLQVKDLQPTDNATLDNLGIGLAAGNNPTLFDQEARPEGREHCAASAALMLLCYQCFSPGGTIGITKWNGHDTSRSSSAAPGIQASPLLTLLRGPNLLTTVHFNLITKQTLGGADFGTPVWDSFPSGQSDPRVEQLGASYLGRLVPLSRAIQLKENARECTLVNGVTYPAFPAFRDPMATVIKRGTGKDEKLVYLRIDLQKHPWRELGGILAAHFADAKGGAYALRHLLNGDCGNLDLWVGGLVTDQAKLIDVAEWTFSVPTGLLGSACLALYTKGVEIANRGEKALREAVKEYCSRLKLTAAGFASAAVTQYWSMLDNDYGMLIRISNAGEAASLDPWRESLQQAMRDSYRGSCPHMTARQIQAWAAGQRKLVLKNDPKE